MDTENTNQNWEQHYADIIQAGIAKSTLRAYKRDLRYFDAWYNIAMGKPLQYPVAKETVIQFILDHIDQNENAHIQALVVAGLRRCSAPLRITTLKRYLSSLSVAHQEQGLASPTQAPAVSMLLRRAARAHQYPSLKKDAITQPILAQLLSTCDDSLRGVRDRALLLLGFSAGGRRRAELAAIKINHLERIEDGYLLHIIRSKTDQEGNGLTLPILGMAAKALSTWLVRSGIREGKLFRGIRNNNALNPAISPRNINNIVKRHIKDAGLNPDEFGAHSLRSGFITEAGRQGVALRDAMQLSGHADPNTALGYHRHGQLLSNPASRLITDLNDNTKGDTP